MQTHEIEQRVRRELAGEERLVWSGQPRQGVLVRPIDALLIPFSLMWGGFAIYWEASVLKTNAPFFFALWGIPFVFVGLYLIFGRFIADARERAKTVYAVTTERVLIISGLFREAVKSLNLKYLNEVSLAEGRDGTGTITLGPATPYSWFATAGWPGTRQGVPPRLEGIREARSVYELIRQSQKRAA